MGIYPKQYQNWFLNIIQETLLITTKYGKVHKSELRSDLKMEVSCKQVCQKRKPNHLLLWKTFQISEKISLLFILRISIV